MSTIKKTIQYACAYKERDQSLTTVDLTETDGHEILTAK